MNTNKVQYKPISKAADWTEMITNDQYEINNIDFSSGTILQVYYTTKAEMHTDSHDCSLPIAAFVTCQARLKLYGELIKIGQRVLYFDTDSIIFVVRDGEYRPALGEHLGDFTNEIDPEEGTHIE